MPFKSAAQSRFMFANKKKLGKEGVDVKEWADATDYSKLPERAPKKPSKFVHVPKGSK